MQEKVDLRMLNRLYANEKEKNKGKYACSFLAFRYAWKTYKFLKNGEKSAPEKEIK